MLEQGPRFSSLVKVQDPGGIEPEDQDDPPSYKFQLIGTQRSAIQRYIHEALLIEMEPPDSLINSKGEYEMNHLPILKLPEPTLLKHDTNTTKPSLIDTTAKRKTDTELVTGHSDFEFSMQFSQRRKRIREMKS